MLILAINTAFPAASLAVAKDAALLGEYFLSGQQPRSETLIKDIKKFLGFLNLKLSDIEVISVVTGPGSYTGLRLGLTTAKTMARTSGTKIVAINSLDILAHQARFLNGLLTVVIKASQMTYNLALFGLKSGQFHRLTADLVTGEKNLTKKLARIKGRYYLAGDVADIYDKILLMNPESRAVTLDRQAVAPNSAAAAAGLGNQKAARGEFSKNVLTLAPEYLHPVRIVAKDYKYAFSENKKIKS